jgi:hypothetical protein
LPLPSTTTVPTPETLAVLKLVDGFAAEPDELVVAVVDGVWEPPPQPAIRAATPSMPPTTKPFLGDTRIGSSFGWVPELRYGPRP